MTKGIFQELGKKTLRQVIAIIVQLRATKILNISVDEKAEYSLLNIRGQVLREGIISEGDSVIDISFLSKGVYLLNLRTDKGVLTKKIIIMQDMNIYVLQKSLLKK